MEDKKIREYVESGGVTCPYCGSEDLNTGRISADGVNLFQEVRCESCRKRWTDQYKLTWLIEEDA